jgi:nucleoside 2-deoxyribosyltransferase
MSKMYLAARWARRTEMTGQAAVVERYGHVVTSSWIWKQGDAEANEECALVDVADIDRSDCLVIFTDPLGSAQTGGGRHFEMGYAYATGKLIIVIGDREHVFCHLPAVRQFDILVEFLEWLRNMTEATDE